MKRKIDKKLSQEIVAAINKDDLEIVKKWQNSENIDLVDKEKRSAIFHAILVNSIDIVRSLLVSKPNLNIQDRNGFSPLHYAAQENLVDIAKLLIENGADLELKDHYGNTPLSKATYSSRGHGELIKLLLSHGADPYNENNTGVSPIKLANIIANYNIKQFFEL